MKKVLWVSRHLMTDDQRQDLERGLGDTAEICQYPKTIKMASDIAAIASTMQVDVICVVLPVHMLADLCAAVDTEKVPVLCAQNTRRIVDGQKDPVFEHAGWIRYREVKIVSERW